MSFRSRLADSNCQDLPGGSTPLKSSEDGRTQDRRPGSLIQSRECSGPPRPAVHGGGRLLCARARRESEAADLGDEETFLNEHDLGAEASTPIDTRVNFPLDYIQRCAPFKPVLLRLPRSALALALLLGPRPSSVVWGTQGEHGRHWHGGGDNSYVPSSSGLCAAGASRRRVREQFRASLPAYARREGRLTR